MTRPGYFTAHSTGCRLAAQVAAGAASYLPPVILKRLVRPLVRCSRRAGPARLQPAAEQAICLIVGDGASQRVRRQHRRAGGPR